MSKWIKLEFRTFDAFWMGRQNYQRLMFEGFDFMVNTTYFFIHDNVHPMIDWAKACEISHEMKSRLDRGENVFNVFFERYNQRLNCAYTTELKMMNYIAPTVVLYGQDIYHPKNNLSTLWDDLWRMDIVEQYSSIYKL